MSKKPVPRLLCKVSEVDFEESWSTLERDLLVVLHEGRGVSEEAWLNCYRVIYVVCSSRSRRDQYKELLARLDSHLRAHLASLDLLPASSYPSYPSSSSSSYTSYSSSSSSSSSSYTSYTSSSSSSCYSSAGAPRSISVAWSHYRRCALWLSSAFAYLNRRVAGLGSPLDPERPESHPVHAAALRAWREVVFDPALGCGLPREVAAMHCNVRDWSVVMGGGGRGGGDAVDRAGDVGVLRGLFACAVEMAADLPVRERGEAAAALAAGMPSACASAHAALASASLAGEGTVDPTRVRFAIDAFRGGSHTDDTDEMNTAPSSSSSTATRAAVTRRRRLAAIDAVKRVPSERIPAHLHRGLALVEIEESLALACAVPSSVDLASVARAAHFDTHADAILADFASRAVRRAGPDEIELFAAALAHDRDSVTALASAWSSFVEAEGAEAIERCLCEQQNDEGDNDRGKMEDTGDAETNLGGGGGSGGPGSKKTGPRSATECADAFMEAVVSVVVGHGSRIARAAKSEPLLSKAHDRGCRAFLKRSPRAAELVAHHAHTLLRKGKARDARVDGCDDASSGAPNGGATRLDSRLDDVARVVALLGDRDVYQRFHSRFLAKRLLSGTSASIDAELGMISRLKANHGYDYTLRMQRMLQDIAAAGDAQIAYERSQANNNNPEMRTASTDGTNCGGVNKKTAASPAFQAKVLTQVTWPLSTPGAAPGFVAPASLAALCKGYESHYARSHSGRRLTWMHDFTTCHLSAKLGPAAGRLEIVASAYQAAVLLAMGGLPAIKGEGSLTNAGSGKAEETTVFTTVSSIGSATGLEGETLGRTMSSLLRVGIVVTGGKKKKRTVAESDEVALNLAFANRGRVRLKITPPVHIDAPREASETKRQVADDRKIQVQAGIVRVLKARRRIERGALIAEVQAQLVRKFAVGGQLISECIDTLIEREYMAVAVEGGSGQGGANDGDSDNDDGPEDNVEGRAIVYEYLA